MSHSITNLAAFAATRALPINLGAEIMEGSRRRRVWRAVCLIVSVLPFAACSIYLHDDNLQKQTDSVLSTYKGADIVGAMNAALEAQAQLDKAEIQSVAENENAARERAVADLISSYRTPRPPDVPALAIDRLKDRVDDRIAELVRTPQFRDVDWLDLHEKIVAVASSNDATERARIALQRAYVAVGGTGFTSCDTFVVPEGIPAAARRPGERLKMQCDLIAQNAAPEQKTLQALIDTVLNECDPMRNPMGNCGEIGQVHQAVIAVTTQIDDQTKAKNDALKGLQGAQQRLKAATASANAVTKEITDGLKQLDGVLKQVDEAAGGLGAPNFSPGTALAAIEFRKTNLRDVIAASGGTANNAASDVNRAVVGVIAGVITLTGTSAPPSVAALSVALAYQEGLAKVVQARLDALTQRKTFLQDQQDSLLRELELLAVASVAVRQTGEGLRSQSCRPRGFANVFPNASCSDEARAAAARALAAYNASWASGRTGARLADRKVTQQITWEKLRVAQEAANARANIQTIALTEIATFGQGGIRPETFAAFLQAFGIIAVANGVN